MFHIVISYEANKSMQDVAKRFEKVLSEKEILRTAAFAINTTARRVSTMVRKEVKKDYTISNKYLDRMSKLSKPAKGTQQGLYAELSYGYSTIPMVGFKFKDMNKGRGFVGYETKTQGVRVEIKKGKQTLLSHCFVKSMASGHLGLWGHGKYIGNKFVHLRETTSKGKIKITEMKTASPFTMYTNKAMSKRINDYVDKTLLSRFTALLEQKVKKLNT